jgi:hypothetical protein
MNETTDSFHIAWTKDLKGKNCSYRTLHTSDLNSCFREMAKLIYEWPKREVSVAVCYCKK